MCYFTTWTVLETQHFSLNVICKKWDLISFLTWYLCNSISDKVFLSGSTWWWPLLRPKNIVLKWQLIIKIGLCMMICVLFSLFSHTCTYIGLYTLQTVYCEVILEFPATLYNIMSWKYIAAMGRRHVGAQNHSVHAGEQKSNFSCQALNPGHPACTSHFTGWATPCLLFLVRIILCS